MPTLFWDTELRSSVNLEVAGAWRYASDPTTQVLAVAYAVGDGDPQIWRPGDVIPPAFIAAAVDSDWNSVAHNYQFERAVATRILEPCHQWPRIPLERQHCTMTMALASALPGALDSAAAALGIPLQKDRAGYKLMRKMSRPLPRRKRDPDGVRWYEPTASELELFYAYAKRDVEIERAVFRALPLLPATEHEHFVLDAIINARGFHVDVNLAEAARAIAHNERLAINTEIAALTEDEITTADQRDRILTFVRRHGHLIADLTRRSVAALLAHEPDDAVRRLLELRRDGARASAHKLDRLLASVDNDHQLRGALRFHAAGTGRWSGRGYQPQNLKKVETADIDAAVDAVLSGDLDRVRALGAPLTIAGDVSRSIVCAAPGHVLTGGDFSAIESRVLAWLAGETWKIESYVAYDKTGDPTLEPYCVTATKMLGRAVTPEDAAGRQIGKTADLALGYGGRIGAWRRFNPSDERTDGEILQNIDDWRGAHPAIGRFWEELRRAALQAVHTGQRIECGRLAFTMAGGTLRLWLPSGRAISYPQARLGPGKYAGTREIYFKDNARGAWSDARAWFGLLTENAVQAVARDLLAAALIRLEGAGYSVVLHVHDEVICEVPEGTGSIEDFLRVLTVLPDWAQGLPFAAKAWSGARFAKTKSKPAAIDASARANGVKPQLAALAPAIEDNDENITVPLADVIGEPLINGKIICPFHDDHNPSLTIFDDHFHCFVCEAHSDVIDWLLMVEGMTRAQAIEHLAAWEEPRFSPAPDAKEHSRACALRLWDEGAPIAGTLAARYLSIRGIELAELPDDIDRVLRFHPHCPFGPGVRHPCLLALMRNVVGGEPVGIHRTALTPEGRKRDRRMLGYAGAVALWPAGSQLVVGEGLETVLAAATRIPYRGAALQPAWALLSAGAIERLPVLGDVKQLIILVDHDRAGIDAARRCADRWQRARRTVIRLTPTRIGADFNDLILPEGAA